MCNTYEENGKKYPLTIQKKQEILEILEKMTAQALRVLAL